MRRLPAAIVPLLAFLVADARAAAEAAPGSPSSDSNLVAWILTGVFVVFALLVGITWRILKAERKRMLEQKPPE